VDSLSQIVLGAAVGEAVLGRRVGNRAMVWGGIAGTLPDLDVLSSLVTDEMSALAYHRAFTHSLAFALLAAPIIGLSVHRLYGGREFGLSDRWFYPIAVGSFWLVLLTGSYLMPVEVYRIPKITGMITLVFSTICGVVGWWELRKPSTTEAYTRQSTGGACGDRLGVRSREWVALFFAAIVTHPLLDCFTAYGTQFLQPLSSLRIAWNTISVVDPLYTLPFLLLLIAAGRRCKASRIRRRLNTAGLTVSSLYLVLTVLNSVNVGAVVQSTLTEEGLRAERSFYSPSLGNNLLWSATAQTGPDTYYFGQYSLLDGQRRLTPFVPIVGNHDLLAGTAGNRELAILRWFTDGYYTVLPLGEGRVRFCDLRYGLLGSDPTDPDSYLFSWTIDTGQSPARVLEQRAGPQGDREEMLTDLWDRIWGI
jgi:inner membrane protein